MAMFESGEKLYAYHGPMLYTAKVLKTQTDPSTGAQKLFLHYDGWNNKWNEWVGLDRVLKMNEENAQRKTDLEAAHRNQEKGVKRRPAAAAAAGAEETRKKRKIDPTQETEDDSCDAQVRIPLPFALKKQLVDDWENVTQKRMLVELPRSPSVSAILKQFLETKRKKPASEKVFEEIMEGLRLYFDRCVGSILLYRFERLQYDSIRRAQPNKPLCEVYGVPVRDRGSLCALGMRMRRG